MYEHLLYKVTYWETPGKERVVKFISNYCLGANLVIIMFDCTKKSSLEKAERILKEIEICDIPIKLLVGNKIDLLTDKKHLHEPVAQQDADKLARTYKCEYYPCNANLNDAVHQIYEHQMSSIHSLVGDSMDLENLINKNIMVGKRVFTHPNFVKNMKAVSYFDSKK
jgi:GTPase SAR1 family protein